MYQSITAAVAGTGFIGPVHVEALKRLGINVKGILGSTKEKSEQAARTLAIPVGYGSFEEILHDDEIQAVHLAVPNVLHYEMAGKVLQAGKHVMCEKPLAMTSEETSELVEIARQSGLAAGVCYNIRFYPLNLEARSKIREKTNNRVYSVVGSYVQDWLHYDTDYNWRVLSEQGGALRAVADIGTHWIDLITSVTGLEIEAVMADLHTIFPVRRKPKGEVETYSGKKKSVQELEELEIDTEDQGCVMFRFKGGARGVLWVSQITAGRKNCLQYEIAASDGTIAWNSERPNELWMGHRDKPNEVLTRDPALMNSLAGGFANYPGGHNEGFPDTFKQCFRAFYDAILHKIPQDQVLYPTFREGHKEVILCEAILESHQRQQWVSV